MRTTYSGCGEGSVVLGARSIRASREFRRRSSSGSVDSGRRHGGGVRHLRPAYAGRRDDRPDRGAETMVQSKTTGRCPRAVVRVTVTMKTPGTVGVRR